MPVSAAPTCRRILFAVLLLLAVASPAAAGIPLIEFLVDEFSVDSYTATHLTIEDMGLGLYGGSAYNQGYRGRDASNSGADSKGNLECRQYLYDQFDGLGLTTTLQGTYDNVVGELTGTTRPEDIFIIGAHYDTTTGNPRPGGDDNGSGTAAIVELARILSQYRFEATIRLIGFNSEEDGLYGSTDYVNNVVKAGGEHVVGMVSLDMILRPQNDTNLSLPVDLDLGCPNSADDLAWVNLFKAASAEYVPELAIDSTTPFTANWGSSDHQPFANNNYAAFVAIENSVSEIRSGSNGYYHTSGDWSDGGAGAAYDYGFATDVTQAMAALLAVEAEILPEPLQFTVTSERAFVYQNTPVVTAGGNQVTLQISAPVDLNGNVTYTTWVTQTGGPGDVQIVETADPWVWQIIGGRHGQEALGEVTLQVLVGGNEYGGEGAATCTLFVRPLADINGDSVVDAEDKLIINQCLNGLETPVDPTWCDLNGDGQVNAEDKLIINQVLNGISPP